MKGFVWLMAFYFISKSIAAQDTGRITGMAEDSITGKPLNFATIQLYWQAMPEGQPVKTTYTDSAGIFTLLNIDTGHYTLVVSHISYISKKTNLLLDSANKDTSIVMRMATQKGMLQNVVVTGRKLLIEQKDDKMIYNVANDPAAKGETATDILRRVPFVNVDADGNVQVNGQSNFKVLLDGKETALFSRNVKDALKAFPGVVISKIEVITSPSAKYDAEGIGGIINIITNKKIGGINGFLSLFARTPNDAWQPVGNINARVGRTGFVLNVTGGGFRTPSKNFQEIVPVESAAYTSRIFRGTSLSQGHYYFGTSEFNYEIDSLAALSVYGSYDNRTTKTKSRQLIIANYTSNPSSQSDYEATTLFKNNTFNIGTDFIKKFNKQADKEFSVRLNMESWKNETDPTSSQIDRTTGTGRFIMNNSFFDNKEYTLQTDFILPLQAAQKIETGGKFIFRKAFSDFASQVKYDPSEEYETDPGNTNYFDYKQNVYGIYSIYNFKMNTTGVRIGGRMEHTEVKGNFISSNTFIRQSYTNFFPNIQVSLKLTTIYSLILAYNKRLQRPYIANLNPFVNNNDTLNISFGNPNLGPQIFHNLSAQNRFIKGNTFVGLTLTGSFSNTAITSYSVFDKNTGVTKTTGANIGRQHQVVVSGNFSTKFTAKWDLSFNGSINYTDISNKLNLAIQNSGINGNASVSNRFSITKKTSLSVFTGFSRSAVGIQTSYPLAYWYGSSVSSKFLNDKLTASFQAFAFLTKELDYTSKIRDPLFRTTTVNTLPLRNFGIFLMWNFGKLKEAVSKKKGVVNDDLLKENKE